MIWRRIVSTNTNNMHLYVTNIAISVSTTIRTITGSARKPPLADNIEVVSANI